MLVLALILLLVLVVSLLVVDLLLLYSRIESLSASWCRARTRHMDRRTRPGLEFMRLAEQ